jgi:hypothetical protein
MRGSREKEEEEGREGKLDYISIEKKRSKRKAESINVSFRIYTVVIPQSTAIHFIHTLAMASNMSILRDQLVPADLVGKTYDSNEHLIPPL